MRRREFMKLTAVSGVGASLLGTSCLRKQASPKPNIVFILADDLGYGDLSCLGQAKFRTPHLDRLAEGGKIFTDHYAGSTVCAPSRSCLMTGRHTGHTYIRGNKRVDPEGQHPLPAESVTVAKLLKQAGYVTGAFGKWGLGPPGSEGDPNNQGFDEFFGYNCQRIAHHYYPWHLWHNQERIVLAENEGAKQGLYAPHLIHEKALEFMERNRENPFFLFVPSIIPHAELFAPDEYMAKYRGRFLPEKAYKGTDGGENFRNGPYGSQPESHAAFAAMIHLLDEQVGAIVAKLAELGLENNTLIVFSSDNGPHKEGGADPDYFDSNGPFRGHKRDLYEGGIRVPTIARWKGSIRPGTRTDHVSAFWDFLPTACELAGVTAPSGIDGISFLPTLFDRPDFQKQHSHLYWEFYEQGGKQAVRQGDWKAIRLNVRKDRSGPLELYNLKRDPGETTNVSGQHPELVEEMVRWMAKSHSDSEIFKF
jgi:arylsulfatase A